MSSQPDTIAAIATAPGQAGIAVVRVSGPESLRLADALFHGGRCRPSDCAGGQFLHGFVHAPNPTADSREIDEVILLVYRSPSSYTREDVVEIQSHGGRVCAARILRAVLRAGARMAEPGEFTRRAFLNGRIDLLQAEAVADLIRAQSDRAAQAAIEQLSGTLSISLARIYDCALSCLGQIEISLDFEEDDLSEAVIADVHERLRSVTEQVRSILDTWREGRLLREGARVVLAGPPNSGKSTLFNRLLGHERSIVTDIPGTTRDTIEETLVLNGIPIRLVDTAGLRDPECLVESEGVRRAQQTLEQADVVVYLIDASQDEPDRVTIDDMIKRGGIVLLNKSDLGCRVNLASVDSSAVLTCTLIDDRDLETIRQRILEKLNFSTEAPPHAVISERHRAQIESAMQELQAARELLQSGNQEFVFLAATHLREALDRLGSLSGRTYSDELLDSIFKRFCVGK
jgi:tRNA modification GTPase